MTADSPQIETIQEHAILGSRFYGRLLNWNHGWTQGNIWHYGIGVSNTHIFDTGAGLRVFRPDFKPKLVIGVDHRLFSPDQTIARLIEALCVFYYWHYGLLGWNCEHLARLVATNDPVSYEVRKLPWPIPALNHNGRHPHAKDDLRNHLKESNPDLLVSRRELEATMRLALSI
jgi:hypothetical protein